jgi:hypothetical protein
MNNEPQELTLLDKAVAHYQRNPYLRALVKLCPYGSAGEAAFLALYELWTRKMDVFAEELIILKIYPAEERIKEREFLDSFAATARRVQDATSDEKIKRFAALFASYYEGTGDFESVDHYEEYVGILSELSEREFNVLVILHRYELQIPQGKQNPLERVSQFWDQFVGSVEKEVGIPRKELTATLTRLQRTGLYEHIVGAYLDYTGGKGNLTPRFTRLISALNAGTLKKEQERN